jgi:hypothetical protein
MDRSQANALEPIEGETIHEPLARLFGLLAFSLLLVLVGVLLLWAAWWTEFFVENRFAEPEQVALFGAVLLLGGALGKCLVALQNNQRLLGYQPTSALHSCSPRYNRPPRPDPNPERAPGRHANGTSQRRLGCWILV